MSGKSSYNWWRFLSGEAINSIAGRRDLGERCQLDLTEAKSEMGNVKGSDPSLIEPIAVA